jgi:multiple sugar transport system ATP-binding protein
MNLLEARLEQADGGPDAIFSGHRLRVPQQVVRDHPALERYLGRSVVLGIRPENLEDASLVHDADPESVIELPVELREELGSEVHVHCAIGQPGRADRPGTGAAEVAVAAEALRKTLLVARMDPRTAVREGEAAKVAVDLSALHFFDPDTSQRIGS